MKISKSDLWVIISIIVTTMLLSLAIALETDNGLIRLLMCIIFGIFSYHLVAYSIKLHNLRKEEKFQTMMVYINCPDRVTSRPQAKFKKGDWITDNTRVLQVQAVMEKYDGTYYHIPYLVAMAKSEMYKATNVDECFRLATPKEIQYFKELDSPSQS